MLRRWIDGIMTIGKAGRSEQGCPSRFSPYFPSHGLILMLFCIFNKASEHYECLYALRINYYPYKQGTNNQTFLAIRSGTYSRC